MEVARPAPRAADASEILPVAADDTYHGSLLVEHEDPPVRRGGHRVHPAEDFVLGAVERAESQHSRSGGRREGALTAGADELQRIGGLDFANQEFRDRVLLGPRGGEISRNEQQEKHGEAHEPSGTAGVCCMGLPSSYCMIAHHRKHDAGTEYRCPRRNPRYPDHRRLRSRSSR